MSKIIVGLICGAAATILIETVLFCVIIYSAYKHDQRKEEEEIRNKRYEKCKVARGDYDAEA